MKSIIHKLSDFLKNLFLIIRKTFFRFLENQGFVISNGLALKTLFALLPALVIIANLLKTLPQFNYLQDSFTELLKKIILPSSYDIIVSWINVILGQTKPISIISYFVFIYLSIDLLITLDNQVEKIWGLNSRRTFIQKILKYWALLTATPFVLGGYFYYSGLIRTLLKSASASSYMNDFIYSSITFLALTTFFFFAYFIIPNSKVDIFKALIVSSIISLVWIVLREFFIYYTMMALSRLSLLYGSLTIIILFIFWVTLNWNALLFGIEFLCVWQNKLYKFKTVKFQELYLFDVALIIFILGELNRDFIGKGEGITKNKIINDYKLNYIDVQKILNVLEEEGYLINYKNESERFYLKKSIKSIDLADVENTVFNRLIRIDYIAIPKLKKICLKLSKFYYKHPKNNEIGINKFL
jgi:membrane protein